MTQQRTEPRLAIQSCIQIRNMITDRGMGELVNITPEGLMLVSDQPITSNAVYQVELALPTDAATRATVELGIECLWCRQTDDNHRYWSGYQIIDASPQALQTVHELLQQELQGAHTLVANSLSS